MKYVQMLIRLMLPVAAIVLLGLAMGAQGDGRSLLLMGGLTCSAAGLWLNLWFQRKERNERHE